MLRHLILPLLLTACTTAPAPVSPTTAAPEATANRSPCAPAAGLAALGDERARSEVVLDMTQTSREELALSLLPCLADPAPILRDGVTYTTLSQMMRSKLIGPETVAAIKDDLLAVLAGPEDEDGFARPFAALALAEVARTDRIDPWMAPEERDALIAAAHTYLAGLTDYRGFSDKEGWRHGVAHTGDLLMQLSLNHALTRSQAEAILAAIAAKVAPHEHAYIFGESERLAAPVLYLAQRQNFAPDEWDAWFASLWPADDPLRQNVYGSEAALRKLHNLRAFSEAVYVSAIASNEETYEPLARSSFALLNSLP
ncbi:DUF2785 domain-containing protein [Hyphomonas sp. WL0036]|uniref:DUF2785 domain-containing protein n=1 Tax=Hyphomonas sediminis TaxID=2866160 RepID=UPI001C813F74|nr:DUF2785 domain-containing protein [Hyphomonas sediminis]MBY9066059.1 DUF2785 domain-containing protein [Hyphomonas sediminis]